MSEKHSNISVHGHASSDGACSSAVSHETNNMNQTRSESNCPIIEVKIEPCSDSEDIFEPDIRLDVGPTLSEEALTRLGPKEKPKGDSITIDEIRVVNILPENAKPTPSRPESTKPHSCAECGRTFKRGSSLALHARAHRGGQPGKYLCHVCNSTFPYKAKLISHMRSGTCIEPVPVACPSPGCERVFKTVFRMRYHHSKQHASRDHQCGVCGKMFSEESSLQRHRSRHKTVDSDTPKIFTCSVCDKTFPLIYPLQAHMRTHTKERPFQCSICVRTFSYKHNMLRHMQRHNKVLHLKCEVCQKVFPRESRLKYHMRVHYTDKKPFKCGVCPKTYSHYQNIMRHYKKKHPDNEYIAPITDAEFANKAWETRMAQGASSNDYILPEMDSQPNKTPNDDDQEIIHVKPEIIILGEEIKQEREEMEGDFVQPEMIVLDSMIKAECCT